MKCKDYSLWMFLTNEDMVKNNIKPIKINVVTEDKINISSLQEPLTLIRVFSSTIMETMALTNKTILSCFPKTFSLNFLRFIIEIVML